MKNIHIENSYNIWNVKRMKCTLDVECYKNFGSCNPETTLNRSYESMYIEWWLHNIGYYGTKPFCFIDAVKKINLRFKDVDIEEWMIK